MALGDPNSAVRESSCQTWGFNGVWHNRATMVIEALDPVALLVRLPIGDLPPTTEHEKEVLWPQSQLIVQGQKPLWTSRQLSDIKPRWRHVPLG